MEQEEKRSCSCGNIQKGSTSGCAIMIGLIILGLFICKGLKSIADKDQYVTVKGLAEREVMANKVVWPIPYYCVSNDINTLYKELDKSNATIIGFLKENGITDEEIILSTPDVTDRLAQTYTPENTKYRYQGRDVITVSSTKVDKVIELIKNQIVLMKKGVNIGNEYGYSNEATFEYTGLNEIKPEMIEEATRNARAVAQKFAEDSESELGGIRNANQGQFSISSDETTPHIKNIRVVTTIDYILKN
ncbi:MAG: SIMPL domain-containing protein [Bacteroidaceae bacterium]|nr:SIMPL domain-containing protein [Bacteroidaceae bacterium]